jgi:hypothetical protein
MKNAVFWDVTPCGSCENRIIKVERISVDPSPMILSTLMIETISSSETSVLTSVARHIIPEDDILHSQRRENLKSYKALTG